MSFVNNCWNCSYTNVNCGQQCANGLQSYPVTSAGDPSISCTCDNISSTCSVDLDIPSPTVSCSGTYETEPLADVTVPVTITNCDGGCTYWVTNPYGTKITPATDGTITNSTTSVTFASESGSSTNTYKIHVKKAGREGDCSFDISYLTTTSSASVVTSSASVVTSSATIIESSSDAGCQDATGNYVLSESSDNGGATGLTLSGECEKYNLGKVCYSLQWHASGTGNILVNGQAFECNLNGATKLLNNPLSVITLDVPSTCTLSDFKGFSCSNDVPTSVSCNQEITVAKTCNELYGPPNFKFKCGGAVYKKSGSTQVDDSQVLELNFGNAVTEVSRTITVNCYENGYTQQVNGTIPCVSYCSW